ncbi:RNA-directed DNA polymerase, eukaryota, reverse transcriptase zinc-binding domain protein [Tanacetum coccineum]
MEECYMVNIYDPQDPVAKLSLRNRLEDFTHHHNGSFILFGDMNVVLNDQERFGSIFSRLEADQFNLFIDFTRLVDLLIGDIRITALDRLWSDHNPILLDVIKSDFVPTPFILYNSWLSRDSFNELSKLEWNKLDVNNNAMDQSRKQKAISDISPIEKKINDGTTTFVDRDTHINALKEVEKN